MTDKLFSVIENEERQRRRRETAGVPHADDVFEEDLRAEVRALLARANVSQRQLAKSLGVSQSSVSHMLADRTAGLSAVEIRHIEELCQVRPGTLYRAAGLIVEPALEEQIFEIPGITDQTADAIVAAIQTVRGRGYSRAYPLSYQREEQP